MAETILTPGQDTNVPEESTSAVTPNYLIKDNFLSEFSTESEKSVARYNLGVPASEDVYTKEEVEPVIINRIKKKIEESLDSADFITRSIVETLLEEFVRVDGTTPFIAPQTGVDPVSNHDLATKIYVDRLIQECLKKADKTAILELVTNILKDYAKEASVYTKSEVYTKDLIDDLNTKFVKADGTVPFTKPVSGRTPQISSHLTTKKYVDDILQTHKEDIDPHGFTEKLANKLKKYALKDSVYDKTQTYSRGQIDSIIDKLVKLAVNETLSLHTESYDPHDILNKAVEAGFIKSDGSVPFNLPLKGINAINDSELTTLGLVKEYIENIEQSIENIPEPLWRTSGPVETTVGYIEDNSLVPNVMTLLQVCDAIFYGNSISLDVPDYVIIGESCPVTICVHGGVIDYAELFLDGELIGTFYDEDFVDGCTTIDSKILMNDSEFKLVVHYVNGAIHEETKTVKCHLPVFVGLLPKWLFGNVVTMDMLIDMLDENNMFITPETGDYSQGHLNSISMEYDYSGPELVHPFVVIPQRYPKLSNFITKSLNFGPEAFNVIGAIPMLVQGRDVIYKMYIYKLALSSINQEVTFKFKYVEQ